MSDRSSRTGDTQERHLLLVLSDCCSKHGSTHTTKVQQEEIPEGCQRDIDALHKILPKVEAMVAVEEKPRPLDVAQLCHFYQTVINGGFCPHAPLLFEWGKSGTAVLPRVFSLYQHLASKAILNNTIAVLKTEESAPVANTICSTIAHMLALIRDPHLKESLSRDLILLAFDLAVIAEVITSESNIQVAIFRETVAKSKSTDEYVLGVSSMDSLYVIWSGTLVILHSLLKLQKGKRLDSSYESAETDEIVDVPSAHADSLWSFVLDDGDLLSTAMAAMRKVLLSSTSETRPALVMRNKVAAAKLLNSLLLDWGSSISPVLSIVTEASLLVSRAVQTHFQDIQHRQKEGTLHSKEDLEFSSLCGKLLCNAVIFPPKAMGGDVAVVYAIRAAALEYLLKCVPYMNTVAQETPFVKDDVVLAHIVLRAIHASLYTANDKGSCSLIAMGMYHCTTNGIFPLLFYLLNSAHLSDVALRIVSAMLFTDAEKSIDVVSVCRMVWTMHGKEDKQALNGEAVFAAAKLSSPVSGSKRRRGSSLMSPTLRIEHSPKRQRARVGRGTNGQMTLATPSPSSGAESGNVLSPMGDAEAFRSGNTSCHESIGNMLHESVLCAKRVVAMVDPCRVLFGTTKSLSIVSADAPQEGISRAIISISCGCRLIFNWIRNNASVQAADEQASGLLQVASLLMKALKALVISLSSHWKKIEGHSAEVPDEARQSTSCIIRVGLDAQFALGRLMSAYPKTHGDIFTDCLDAIAGCARDIWAVHHVLDSGSSRKSESGSAVNETNETPSDGIEVGDCQEKMERGCRRVCCELTKTLSCGFSDSHEDTTPCLCGLLLCPDTLNRRVLSSSKDVEAFQYDCTMMFYEKLSNCGICALLSCLRPLTTTDDIASALTTHPMGHLFSSVAKGARATPTAMTLSPLFLLSVAVHTVDKVISLGVAEYDCNGQNKLQSTGSDLSVHVSSCLDKVQYWKYLEGLSERSDASSAASYLSINRLHELSDLTLRAARDYPETSSTDYDIIIRGILLGPHTALAFVLGRLLAPGLSAAENDDPRWRKDPRFDSLQETYRSSRIALLSASAAADDKSLSLDVRFAKWKCIASTCLTSSVNEMSRIRGSLEASETKCDDGMDFEISEEIEEPPSLKKAATSLIWLLRSVFADDSSSFRDNTAREVGRVLLGNKSSLLYALFSTPSNWRRQDDEEGLARIAEESFHQCAALELVVAPLFQEIDRMLCRYCQVPQSQLSFTMGHSVMNDGPASGISSVATRKASSRNALSYQRSAVTALSSLCQYADIESRCGLLVFEHSISRLVRFWTALESEQSEIAPDDAANSMSTSAMAFGEMIRLNRICNLRRILVQKSFERFMPRLFSDMLLPSTGMISGSGGAEVLDIVERESRERQFRFLLTFIGSFLLPTHESAACSTKTATVYGSHCIHCVLEFVATVLPSVITAFVMVEDHDLLLLVTGFRLFLQGKKRQINKAAKMAASFGSGRLLGSPPRSTASTSKMSGVDSSRKELVEHTKLLCLSPEIIELILPRILMLPDRSQLIFFLDVVLQRKMPLQQMLASKDGVFLKGIVWEYGRTGDVGSADRALRTAAKARERASQAGLSGDSPSGNRRQAEDDAAACCWVTYRFMYLLVNVVQYRWRSRSISERARALRSLRWMIKFLSPAEAPQYLPQIMATINVVMSGDPGPSDLSQPSTWQLRLLAIQALSEFVRTAIQCQYETVGSSLATIVVSLFPVLTPDVNTAKSDNERRTYEEAGKVAVDLLEWLTQGSVGKNLATYFRDVPFLPPTKALDKVREALKTHGVSFDNLLVFSSTDNTQYDLSVRGSLTSEGGTSNGDNKNETVPTYSLSAQAALRRRLHVLRRLFSHENVSVRRVVLQHLIDLLRANRGLLQRLIESEEGTSLDHFITVSYAHEVQTEAGPDAINGSVTLMVDSLLQRCFTEVDSEARLLLATCWGELGAIDVHRLGEMRMSGSLRVDQTDDDGRSWRLLQAPWQSRPARYELKVVTKHLVVALKAAPTSSDQHRIAFTIQQILELLDESVKISNRSESNHNDIGFMNKTPAFVKPLEKSSRSQMSEWLREKLSKAGVLETVEPYWFSMFNEVESFVPTEPPFFRDATSYFGWLSKWSRYMLKRSSDDGRNQWCSFFYACRTAVRSHAGMSLSEFILPLLVLDRMCYGNSNDERAVVQEFLDVLDFSSGAQPGSWESKMSQTERQKAVNAVFTVLDTLQYWSERETEERFHHSRSASAARSTSKLFEGEDDEVQNTCWLWDESHSAIDGLLKAVPLSLQADAAAAVGMHARALRLMEMAARAEVVQAVYDNETIDVTDSKSEGKNIIESQKNIGTQLIKRDDIDLFKQVLGHLNDCETMEGVASTSDAASSAIDGIRVREAKGDWAGASYDYERALQLNESVGSRLELERGSLRCLLELGQFESVLHQVNGIVHEHRQLISEGTSHPAVPFAVEAAWRLGRWSTLTQILDDVNKKNPRERCLDSEGLYRLSLGKAMQGLHNRSESVVATSIRTARQALMSGLSNVARDSYSRSYSYLIRLHCLREVENACSVMCNHAAQNSSMSLEEIASSCSHEGWNWDGRLNVVSVAGCSSIIDVRLALARLAGDSKLEGSLFLTVGKRARKSGLVHVAANFLAQAEACCMRSRCGADASSTSAAYVNELLSSIRLQFAKLKHRNGESSAALRILGLENVAGMVETDENSLRSFAIKHERNAIPGFVIDGRDQAADVNRFSRRLLQSTQWMVEGGIKGGLEVMDRFRMVQRLSPTWEKGYFQFAKYVDSILETRIAALADRTGESGHLSSDEDMMRASIILRDDSGQRYLLLAMEQYINALKFNSKHVYQALPRLLSLWFDFTSFQEGELDTTAAGKGRNGRVHSAHYQVEANDLMSKNLRAIPAHCFYTAMPQLISRVGHGNKDTALVVRATLTRILTKHPGQAMWGLAWLLNSASPERVHVGEDIFKGAQSSLLKRKENKSLTLLSSSKSLFRFFIDLAKYEPKDNARSVNIKPWRGDAALIDFIPPIQAALSVSPTSADNGNANDAFPILVPRMRTFCSKVMVMSSKAKPKRLKAFVVPEEQLRSRGAVSPSSNSKDPQPGDMGELHFLVKQEARGDLRKDARVQDLNNVINRLLAVSGGSRQRRRLHLRTFAVTCLSEDCGILEWIPNTESMRSLVIQSYNPQASPFSVRRRGKTLGNYGGNMALKSGFEKCQSLYFKNGNLKCAAAMFHDIILTPNPPLLYWYFVQKFMDPHSWYEARTRFTLSCAAWSAVGHVIGLGDRHSENILVDTASGQCVHVDFDCIFDKGLNLPKPEVVPFRLTANMLDAFGPIGADGVYTHSLKAAMTTLRDNRDTLLSVLEPFIKDPIIDWKRQRSQQKHGKSSTHLEAKRSIKVIDQRLRGVYNLRNPNSKKVKRTDGWSMDQDDEMMQMLPLSVEGQVHKMITEATSNENLVQLYVGWMPWV